jgi:hypothetical protein
VKSEMWLKYSLNFFLSLSVARLSGMILTPIVDFEDRPSRRIMIVVANRVHKPSPRGNSICVMASRTELLPEL